MKGHKKELQKRQFQQNKSTYNCRKNEYTKCCESQHINHSDKPEQSSGGYISIFVLLTGMILLLITLSLLTRQVNEVMAVGSFQHKTQAHYLAEAGMDMALWQLYEWSEEAIAAYEEGVALAAETGMTVPSLKEYSRSHVIFQLYRLNEYNNTPLDKPFSGLEEDHSIRLKVEASIDEAQVTLVAQGICEKARVTQQAVVALPRVTQVTSLEAEGGTGNEIVIQGLHLISRFQTPSIWY